MTNISRGIIVHLALGAVIGILLFYIVQPAPPPRVDHPVILVSRAAFEKHEPDTKVGVLERVVRPPRKLEQRVVADSAGREMVDAFVAAATAAAADTTSIDSASGPTIQPERGPTPAQRLAYAYAARWTRSQLEIFTFTSDGAKELLKYNVCPNGSFVMTGDEALVQGPRFCWIPDVLGLAGAGAIGYGLASGDPLVVGVGVVLLVVRRELLKR